MSVDTPVSRAPAKHWRRNIDERGVGWLTLDKAETGTNTLSQKVLRELEGELDALTREPLRGLVIKSGKTSGFIAGADVGEFQTLGSAAEGSEFAARGQALFERLAEASFPTVAAIHGFALGGGLELALACNYRVAAESHERNLGLPEVQLGVHPGFGGTVRSVQLLGAPLALDLMLTGRSVSPFEALKVGLVDRVVPRERLDEAALSLIEERPPRHRPLWHLRLASARPVRPWLARAIRRRVSRRANPSHYPAPFAIIDLWERHGAVGREAYAAEARSIGSLLVTDTCRNLVRVFFLRERLRHLAPKGAPVERVHVVGAGVMGGDIASWCALRGLTVSLQDKMPAVVESALERARRFFDRRLRAPGEAESALARLRADLTAEQVTSADIVIEAIVEQLDSKQALFRDLEPKLREDAILATNTSSIRLEEMAEALHHPQRFVGLHFFNPVARLPLVEVIRGVDTSNDTMQRALSFVIQIGKLPLPCRSAPGFVVNRVLAPYMLEALRAHEEGTPLETIDAAAVGFGMPMGPVELADRVGLDVAKHVSEVLLETLDVPVPAVLGEKVAAGALGLKSGRGFYEYENDRPRKARRYPPPDDFLRDRLILALLNEAVACYGDGVIADYDLLDAGVVFGTGFAPYTGGPINYARQRGIARVVARLEELAARFGPRFAPHPGWRKLAAEP